MSQRLAPLLFALAALAGCVAKQGESPGVEIFQACYPPAPDTTTGACTFPTGKCLTVPLGTYVLDVDNAPGAMLVGVEVHNQLTDNTNTDTGGLNTHNAFVKAFTVSYSGDDIPDTTGEIQSTVPSAGSTVLGVDLVSGPAFLSLYNQLHGTLNVAHLKADLTLTGNLGDQSSFKTAPRSFGIDVCAGCVVPLTCDAGKTLFCCPWGGMWPAACACSSSGGGGTTTYTVSVVTAGLASSPLVVSCTGLSDLTITDAVDSVYPFSGSLPDTTAYTCTITGQPTTPTNETCTITGGTGTGTVNGANVFITVSCI
ncbi:MAG TPA: hypothetical protein VFG59_04795 [Anaeromyxobacter sp.]|nr:hypothetical protein [Anaeromyxobacter sp.]